MEAGGPARVINLWGNYFVKNGYSVEIVSNIDVPLFYDFDTQIKYSILGIDKFQQKNPVKTFYKMYTFLKGRKKEILVFNKRLYISYIFFLKKLGLIDKSLKLVYFAHGGSSDFKTMYSNMENYMIDAAFDEIIALHNDYESFFFEIKSRKRKIINAIFPNQWQKIRKKINYIPNPVTFRSNEKANYNIKKVLAVGRLDYIKRFDLLIRAWKSVYIKHPDWKLIIVGDGKEKQRLQNLIEALSLQRNVELVGAKQDVKSFYISSSIYAMSSKEEGMPMVLVEAMECSLPIVAFENVGAKFLVKDGKNGLLCEVGDVKCLSNKIIHLIEDKPLREEMGKKSKEIVKEFYIENLAHRWDRILNG